MLESLGAQWLIFGLSALVIAVIGTRLTGMADRLADQTGLGEAFFGAVFLGAITSLPGITASVVAAIDDRPQLALSNALGGIAAQTVFLVIGDLVYRRANLEHAAASLENLLQSTLLIALLALLLLAQLGPELTIWGMHPVTPLLFLSYFFGQRLIMQARKDPMWPPHITGHTRRDEPDEDCDNRGSGRLWAAFGASAVVIVVAGWALTKSAEKLGPALGLDDSIVGATMTGIATSLPELVTCIAAVRRGALTLAVGGILGGNAFDTLFAGTADIAYRDGSLYHAAGPGEPWLLTMAMLMTAVLLLGLLRRERGGPANIGFESLTVLLIYLLGMWGLYELGQT